MKSKPNIQAFLDGGAAAEQSKREIGVNRGEEITTDFRKQMVMQLPVPLINDLKKRVLELSLQTGKRVTQQQLVEDALKSYLYR